MHFGKSAACECDRKTGKMRIVGCKWNALQFIHKFMPNFYPNFISSLLFISLEYFHVLDCVECGMPFIYRDLLSLFTQMYQKKLIFVLQSECICTRTVWIKRVFHLSKIIHISINGISMDSQAKRKSIFKPYTFPPAHWKAKL